MIRIPEIAPVLRTERLVLRGPRAADLPAFADFLASDRARFVGGPGRVLWDSARAFGHLAGLWALNGWSAHVICLADGTPIGHGGPWRPHVWPEPEIGWCLWDGAHEGKGYVTEAMTRLLDWSWRDLGLESLVSYIDPANAASRAVARRLGARIDPAAAQPVGPDGASFGAEVWRHHPEGRA